MVPCNSAHVSLNDDLWEGTGHRDSAGWMTEESGVSGDIGPGAWKRCGHSRRATLGCSCLWGLTPSMCPPCHALGPSSPVGLRAVEDSPEF